MGEGETPLESLERRCQELERENERLRAESDGARAHFVQAVLAATPDGFVVLDRGGLMVEVNAAFCAMTGYPREALLGRHITELDVNERPDETAARVRRVSEKGAEVFETRHRRRDGSVFPVEVSTVFAQDRFVCFCRDLSDRQQREERIAILGQMLDDAPASITIHDEGGRFLYANRATLTLHGYTSAEEFLALNLHELDVPESEALIAERMRMIAERGEAYFEVAHHRKDGSLIPLGVLAKAIRWQGRPALLSVAADITLQKAAEQAQRDRQAELEQIFEGVPDALVYTDPERRITRVNQSFVRMFGYAREEVLGRSTEILYAHPEAFHEQGRVRYNAAARDVCQPYELEYRRKDGELFPAETVGTSVRDGEDRVTGFMGLIREISERRRAERERERLHEQLAHAQRLESVGRLAGGVAHDFNNLLGVILGHVDLALSDLAAGSPLREDLEQMRRAAERSADLTRQLLAFARRQTISPRLLDLNATIESTLRMLGRLIGEHIRLLWRPAPALPPVLLDPAQVDQLLTNLVVNARDAIGAGGGEVRIETGLVELDARRCVDHPGCAPGAYVEVVVCDDGCGMDEEAKARAFDPFFTTKGLGEGTGLGLATVYGIVKQNQGLIELESAPGAGATFRIYLPARVGAAATVHPAPRPAVGGDETILVVEDEALILRMTTRMLERLGYQVLAASTPGEAIARAEAHEGELELLITDVVMPEMNGRELVERLRARRPRLRCLYISGYTADVIADQGVLDAGLSFLQKPFAQRELAAKVREVLDAEP